MLIKHLAALHLSLPLLKGGEQLSVIAAGIPNITGSFYNQRGAIYNWTGAFYGNTSTGWSNGDDNPNGCGTTYIDASRCSTVYGKSDTVQVAAIQLIQQIKF